MKNVNGIGLDKKQCGKLTENFNALLANYSVFYQNVRGYHWNIKGEKFFELHVKFEELYTDLQMKIDEIAERILMLGGIPEHNFTEYSKTSEIKESKMVSDGRKAIQDILNSLSTVIGMQRNLLKMSDEANDEGTNAMMSDYIRSQEKMVWMYSAFLK